MPMPITPSLADLYPDGFNKGFAETLGRYGALLDVLAMGIVNGFTYHQPRPFDLPGPDGPMSPEEIGAEIGRRTSLAEAAFADKMWRQDLEMWDTECKPASIDRHKELGAVDLSVLSESELAAHLDAVSSNLSAMVYQHHRFNLAAMVPVGDFALQVSAWTGTPPTSFLNLIGGHSSISGLAPDEMAEAVAAIRASAEIEEILRGDAPAAARLEAMRERSEAIDDYVRMVEPRVVSGFDIPNPTLKEKPDITVGKLLGALDFDGDAAAQRADSEAATVRDALPEEHRSAFDELLAEARAVYRLRDERGTYSDITAIGLLRLALLEVGARANAAGLIEERDHILDATPDEAAALLSGTGPTAEDLAQRAALRAARTAEGAPRYLGDPPPPPPPIDELPPALGRLMSALGFQIEGVLGQMKEPAGDAATVIGISGSPGVVTGRARVMRTADDIADLEDGEVLISQSTGEAVNAFLHLVSGIVTDHGSYASHAAIMGREMGFPTVVGTVDGSERIRSGDQVTVDGDAGEVRINT